MTILKSSNSQIIGSLLTRIVVPAWILTGAVFKLLQTSPRTLPKITILDTAAHYDIDLYLLLAILLSLEFLAVSVMIFLKQLARPMAIFMLTCFCLILLNEIRGGATNCGCLGTFSPSPWMMFAIDGVLLLGIVIFATKPTTTLLSARWSIGAALTGIIIGTIVSFAVVIPAGRAPVPIKNDNTAIPIEQLKEGPKTPDEPSNLVSNPSPKPLSGYWYVDNIDTWIGDPWGQVELFQYLPRWPIGLDEGERYVIFYSRTCDHCEEMFWSDLLKPYDPPIIAVEIPADKETLTATNAWEMPETNCVLLNLPIGTDWIITSPLSLRLENGIVTCAEEGDHKECFRLN